MKQHITGTRSMTFTELGILMKYRNNSVFLLGIILILTIPLIWSMAEGLLLEKHGVLGFSFIGLFFIMAADIYLYSYFSRYDMDIEERKVVSGCGVITDIYQGFRNCYCVIEGRRFRLPEGTPYSWQIGETAVIEYAEKSLHLFYISAGSRKPVMETGIQ